MAFSIVPDWWLFLSRRVGGDAALQQLAPGDAAASHPRVDEAAAFATDTIRNALLQKYSEASVDALTPEKVDAEMRHHAGSLALYALSTHGGGRPDTIDLDYAKADDWLSEVRKGHFRIEEVIESSAVAPEAQGSGLVRFRSRRRIIDRSDPDSDYNRRNPRI